MRNCRFLLIFFRISSLIGHILIISYQKNRQIIDFNTLYYIMGFIAVFQIMELASIYILSEKKYSQYNYLFIVILQPLIVENFIQIGSENLHVLGNVILEIVFFRKYREGTNSLVQKIINLIPFYVALRIVISVIQEHTYSKIIDVYLIISLITLDLYENRNQAQKKPPGILNKLREEKFLTSTNNMKPKTEFAEKIVGFQEDESFYKVQNLSPQQSNRFNIFVNNPFNLNVDANKSRSFSQQSCWDNQFYKQILNVFPFGCVILSNQCQLVYRNYKIDTIIRNMGDEQLIETLCKIIRRSKLVQKQKSKEKSPYRVSPDQISQSEFFQIISADNDFKIIENIVSQSKRATSTNLNVDKPHPHNPQATKIQSFLSLSYQSPYHSNGEMNLKIKIYNSQSNLHIYTEPDQVFTMIVLKNVQKKDKIQKLQKQRMFQNSLLESFSHELRTPLNCGIQSMQALLSLENRSFQKTLLQSALGSNYLLLHQINDILDSAAMETENFIYTWSYFSFSEIVNNLTQIYQESFNLKRINFKTKFNQGQKSNLYTQIRSDKNRLTQILVNLLNNSLKFTPEGGTIELSYTIENLNNHSKVRYARIQVRDTGIGIDHMGLQKISNYIQIASIPSFKQIETEGEFIGLGLCFCGKLAQGLSNVKKDNFEVRSNLNQGTTVTFYVDDQSKNRKKSLRYKQMMKTERSPSNVSIQNLEELQQVVSETDNKIDYQQFKDNESEIKVPVISLCFDKLQNQKEGFNLKLENNVERQNSLYTVVSLKVCKSCSQILIVDDIPFNHLALKAMLSQYRLSSESAYDGFQAIQIVENRINSHCSSFRLILMDIEMPMINGFETTKKIQTILKQKNLQSSIVMCSAYDTMENIDAARECGMDGLLFKPVNMENLKKVLQKCRLK